MKIFAACRPCWILLRHIVGQGFDQLDKIGQDFRPDKKPGSI